MSARILPGETATGSRRARNGGSPNPCAPFGNFGVGSLKIARKSSARLNFAQRWRQSGGRRFLRNERFFIFESCGFSRNTYADSKHTAKIEIFAFQSLHEPSTSRSDAGRSPPVQDVDALHVRRATCACAGPFHRARARAAGSQAPLPVSAFPRTRVNQTEWRKCRWRVARCRDLALNALRTPRRTRCPTRGTPAGQLDTRLQLESVLRHCGLGRAIRATHAKDPPPCGPRAKLRPENGDQGIVGCSSHRDQGITARSSRPDAVQSCDAPEESYSRVSHCCHPMPLLSSVDHQPLSVPSVHRPPTMI